MTNLLAIEDSDQRLNTINTCIQPPLKGRNRENLKMIGYVVFEIQHIQSFTVLVLPKGGRSANQFLKIGQIYINLSRGPSANVAICEFVIFGSTVEKKNYFLFASCQPLTNKAGSGVGSGSVSQ